MATIAKLSTSAVRANDLFVRKSVNRIMFWIFRPPLIRLSQPIDRPVPASFSQTGGARHPRAA